MRIEQVEGPGSQQTLILVDQVQRDIQRPLVTRPHHAKRRHPAKLNPHHRIGFAIDRQGRGNIDIRPVEIGQLLLPLLVVEINEYRADDVAGIEFALGRCHVRLGHLRTWGRRFFLATTSGGTKSPPTTTPAPGGFPGLGSFFSVQPAVLVLVKLRQEFPLSSTGWPEPAQSPWRTTSARRTKPGPPWKTIELRRWKFKRLPLQQLEISPLLVGQHRPGTVIDLTTCLGRQKWRDLAENLLQCPTLLLRQFQSFRDGSTPQRTGPRPLHIQLTQPGPLLLIQNRMQFLEGLLSDLLQAGKQRGELLVAFLRLQFKDLPEVETLPGGAQLFLQFVHNRLRLLLLLLRQGKFFLDFGQCHEVDQVHLGHGPHETHPRNWSAKTSGGTSKSSTGASAPPLSKPCLAKSPWPGPSRTFPARRLLGSLIVIGTTGTIGAVLLGPCHTQGHPQGGHYDGQNCCSTHGWFSND